MITSEQCRAARGMLAWTQGLLAERAGVSMSTVRDFEKGRHMPIGNNMAALQAALETAGVVFLDEGQCLTGGAGVRMKAPLAA